MTVNGDKGLLLDYGGVLTTPIGPSFRHFEETHGIEHGLIFRLLIEASRDETGGLIGGIERGEITTDEFDGILRDLLRERGIDLGERSPAEGLFAGVRPDSGLWDVAATARRAGVRTALLSNSWGTHFYPWDRLEEVFDHRVISGEVGLRKPDPAIYLLACERLELPPEACAFVDDLPGNVEVAEDLGMFAVLHRGDEDATTAALEGFLGIPLRT